MRVCVCAHLWFTDIQKPFQGEFTERGSNQVNPA